MKKKKETKRFDLMEFGSALGREEMKKLMAGSDGCSFLGECNCNYVSEHGTCYVYFVQSPTYWEYNMVCDDQYEDHDTGPGCYGGTLCGGQCPPPS